MRDEIIRAIKKAAATVDDRWVEGLADEMADEILKVLGKDE